MREPTCPHCQHGSFQAADYRPRDAKFPYIFVYCESCGAVVGVLEHTNIGWLIRKLAEMLGVGELPK